MNISLSENKNSEKIIDDKMFF